MFILPDNHLVFVNCIKEENLQWIQVNFKVIWVSYLVSFYSPPPPPIFFFPFLFSSFLPSILPSSLLPFLPSLNCKSWLHQFCPLHVVLLRNGAPVTWPEVTRCISLHVLGIHSGWHGSKWGTIWSNTQNIKCPSEERRGCVLRW